MSFCLASIPISALRCCFWVRSRAVHLEERFVAVPAHPRAATRLQPFHYGVIIVVLGHFVGFLTPDAWLDRALSPSQHELLAMVTGGIAGAVALVELSILLHRRLGDPRIAATAANETSPWCCSCGSSSRSVSRPCPFRPSTWTARCSWPWSRM